MNLGLSRTLDQITADVHALSIRNAVGVVGRAPECARVSAAFRQ
jgi:hypothetical protein